MKKVGLFLICVFMVTGLCACGLGHQHVWAEATCTTPKTCRECGKTEGTVNPNAHSTNSGQCEYCGNFVLNFD